MLNKQMTLREMVEFKPSTMDMANLDLSIVTYIKVSIVSLYKELNYDFVRYLFKSEDIRTDFKDIDDTIFYDFDGTNTNSPRFITIFELYSLYSYSNASDLLKEILEEYSHEAEVLIDFYTHDNKEYRLSNLDGIVKLEELNVEKIA